MVGIDLSSTKFAAVGFVDGVYSAHLKSKYKTLLELKSLLELFLDDMPSGDVGRAYVEEAVVARGGSRVTIQQAYAMGAIRLALEEVGWTVGLVNVGTWKKHVVGSGRSDKAAVSAWMQQHEPERFSLFGGDQDLIDAWCVGTYGLGVLRTARILDERGVVQGDDASVLLVR